MTHTVTHTTDTIYVSVGNSDDKLRQGDWAALVMGARDIIRELADQIQGEWYSAPDSGYQNACFCAQFSVLKADQAKAQLKALGARWGQDSIAWAEAFTEFI